MIDPSAIGWLAAGLTLLASSMRSMPALRLASLASNAGFITYGVLNELYPVVALHLLLFPCNLVRLIELRAAGAGCSRQVQRGGDCTRHLAAPYAPGRDWLFVATPGPSDLAAAADTGPMWLLPEPKPPAEPSVARLLDEARLRCTS